MIKAADTLKGLPEGLRTPLLKEYNNIVKNFMEHRWQPAELYGGLFSEIVYTIIDGFAKNAYNSTPMKPRNFVDACKQLENNTHVPRSFQILIPRLLPALYEIRNNRGVGHVGGDVDSNFMDASAVVSISSWVMAELVRVFHGIKTEDAQAIVNQLVERRIPIVWKSGDIKRILRTDLALKDQILILTATSSGNTSSLDLIKWTECSNASYFRKLLMQLHKQRLIEYERKQETVEILPPGFQYVSDLLKSESTTH